MLSLVIFSSMEDCVIFNCGGTGLLNPAVYLSLNSSYFLVDSSDTRCFSLATS